MAASAGAGLLPLTLVMGGHLGKSAFGVGTISLAMGVVTFALAVGRAFSASFPCVLESRFTDPASARALAKMSWTALTFGPGGSMGCDGVAFPRAITPGRGRKPDLWHPIVPKSINFQISGHL